MGPQMKADDLSLQRNCRYLEWIIIVLTGAEQIRWTTHVVQFHWLMTVSFVFLAAALPLSIPMPTSIRGRFFHLLAQTFVISVACALGIHRRYSVYFLVLGAKAAALLPRRQMLLVALMLLMAHVVAGATAQYLLHHVYTHLHVMAPNNAPIGETESKVYFTIGLIAVIFVARKVVSERESRKAQQLLSQRAEELAVDFERDKIAREIHDNLGHTLASLMIQLELAEKLADEDKIDQAKDLVARSHDSTVSCLQQLRRTVTAIRNEEAVSRPEQT
jgi:signal transduction histidine kinase